MGIRIIFKFISLLWLINLSAYAQSPKADNPIDLQTKIKKMLLSAQYNETLDLLKSSNSKSLTPTDMAYYLAIAYSKLLRYDEAIAQFKLAIKNDSQVKDLYYEYGQALFGNNNLRAARDAFRISATRNYNYTASIYYVAHCSELLDEFQMAKHNYRILIKDSRTDKNILQVSLFQYSRIMLQLMRDQEKILIRQERNLTNNIPKYIIPLLNKALLVDQNTEVAAEINKLIVDLTKEFNLDPNIMINGRRLSPSRFSAYLASRIKHDNNIFTTKRGSAYLEEEGYIKYEFRLKKRFIISPDLKVTQTHYHNQKEDTFYKNDAITVTTDLKNKLEHRVNHQPASLMLDLNLSKQYKDINSAHKLQYYYQSYGASLAEQFNFFKPGESTVKIKNSEFRDMTDDLYNSRTLTSSFDQYFFLNQGQHLLITTFETSFVNYYNYKYLNSNSLSIYLIYLMFEVFPTYTLQLAQYTTITDTRQQRDTRGYELSLNPSIEISKRITNDLTLTLNYSFTTNNSKSESSKYNKQVISSDVTLNF